MCIYEQVNVCVHVCMCVFECVYVVMRHLGTYP